MKILHVMFGLSGFAGDSKEVLLVVKSLQALGHTVEIITTDADIFFYDKEKSKMYSDIRRKLIKARNNVVDINGIPVYVLHCLTPKMGMYCPNAAKIAKKIIKNYDIIHVHNWYNHLGMIFSKVATEYKIPFVVSAYGSLQSKARIFKKRQKWIANQLYTKKLIPSATGLHSVGDLETAEYINLGVDPSKIYRIDLGIVLENFEIKERTDILDRLGVNKENKPYLLFLGRIDRKKGIELLLEAFSVLLKDHRNLILVIAGSGDISYEQKIRQLVNDLKLENSVKFTGFVKENEKLELLESAKIFVLTSYSDVHPNAVIEALTMGVPVMITKTCDYPEVDEYQAGITAEPNVNSIYSTLIKILASEDNLSQFSQNAKKLISDKFLLKNQIKKYEQMYLDVIEKYQRKYPEITKR